MPEPTHEKGVEKGFRSLIAHHGGAILRIGGVTDLDRWQAAPTDLVLPAMLPDGLIFARRAGRDRPEPHVIEIATYAEARGRAIGLLEQGLEVGLRRLQSMMVRPAPPRGMVASPRR